MVQLRSTLALALVAAAANAAPLNIQKRIAQVIADSTAKWEQACIAAGGGQKCNPLSITAFSTLLAAAGDCDQQNAADSMIDLAKTLNNDATMITLTQIFAQQPRNTPNSLSVPYCQNAPKNPELNGLFQCQFQGADLVNFVGGLKVGQKGTIPFGLNQAVSPAGSCPAHTSGPIAAGTQLTDIAGITPGVGSPSSNSNSSSGGSNSAATTAATPVATAGPTSSAASASASSSDFHLQNGLDAQKLNAQFATLTASSSCTDGQQACVNGAFAQCVGGKFSMTQCSGGTQCFALPLVNKPGTSVTCDTQSDAVARITATGATGGLTGSGASSSSSGSTPASNAVNSSANSAAGSSSGTTAASASSSSSADFHLQNGLDAQKLNAQFATLTAGSSCNDGEQACVNGAFAQCVGGKFSMTQCSGGTQCFALPLVNKAGTSVTCDTESDAVARIAATGATGGLTGSGSSSAAQSNIAPASNSASTAASSNTASAAKTASSSSSSGDFHLANGQAAQALNAKFATLTANSACNAGDQACVNGQFAQCVGGKFVLSSCGSGNICVALPLVNKSGTSVTCDTQADAVARIAATGASGSLTG